MSKAGKRTDGNQAEIVRKLRARGYSVADTHEVGNGFGDIVVGAAGVNFLFEIKDPASDRWIKLQKRKLEGKEKTFHEEWKGQIHVIETAEAAERIMLACLT